MILAEAMTWPGVAALAIIAISACFISACFYLGVLATGKWPWGK
jgi:hypothetical protein